MLDIESFKKYQEGYYILSKKGPEIWHRRIREKQGENKDGAFKTTEENLPNFPGTTISFLSSINDSEIQGGIYIKIEGLIDAGNEKILIIAILDKVKEVLCPNDQKTNGVIGEDLKDVLGSFTLSELKRTSEVLLMKAEPLTPSEIEHSLGEKPNNIASITNFKN